MDKRYQIFVSSTYADLKSERRAVMQALMEMDCIPAGMELFPAMDEEQLKFICRIIDDCDYYLLIIGGRYGSLAPDGLSYTEKEFDYAVKIGLHVVALLHEDPAALDPGKADHDPNHIRRLEAFKDKVKTGRLVKLWKTPEELPGLVALSLQKTIKTFPAVGWVRADKIASEKALTDLNELHSKNDDLRKKIKTLKDENAQLQIQLAEPPEHLAGLDEAFRIKMRRVRHEHSDTLWEATATWGEIFSAIAPHLLHPKQDAEIKSVLNELAMAKDEGRHYASHIEDQNFQTIKVHLMALGLVRIEYSSTTGGGAGLFWWLTPRGNRKMVELRTVPSGHK
jgi:hypothetical protein